MRHELKGQITLSGAQATLRVVTRARKSRANEIVGTYNDRNGLTHRFVYNTSTNKWVVSVDDPNGIGMTVVNGTNDKHELVGFWGTSPTNTGFVATLP